MLALGMPKWKPKVLFTGTENVSSVLRIASKKAILLTVYKVKKIYEDSSDSIPSPSPSVKIQIIGGKFHLR